MALTAVLLSLLLQVSMSVRLVNDGKTGQADSAAAASLLFSVYPPFASLLPCAMCRAQPPAWKGVPSLVLLRGGEKGTGSGKTRTASRAWCGAALPTGRV